MSWYCDKSWSVSVAMSCPIYACISPLNIYQWSYDASAQNAFLLELRTARSHPCWMSDHAQHINVDAHAVSANLHQHIVWNVKMYYTPRSTAQLWGLRAAGSFAERCLPPHACGIYVSTDNMAGILFLYLNYLYCVCQQQPNNWMHFMKHCDYSFIKFQGTAGAI